MIARKRSASRSRISGWLRRRSRATSWRSSKSSADSRRLLDGEAGLFVGGGPLAARTMCLQVEQLVGPRFAGDGIEQRPGARALEVGGGRVLRETTRCKTELLEPLAERRPVAELEHEITAGGAQRLVDPRDHAPQAAGAVSSEQLDPHGVAVRAERAQCLVERLAGENRRLRFVELPEAGVEPCLERIGLQQPIAEAVDRRDPRAVELPGEVGAAAPAELGADARPEFTRGALRVGDHEDRVDVDAVVADRADEPLDEARGLAGPRAGGDEDTPLRLDRLELLGVRRPAHKHGS